MGNTVGTILEKYVIRSPTVKITPIKEDTRKPETPTNSKMSRPSMTSPKTAYHDVHLSKGNF